MSVNYAGVDLNLCSAATALQIAASIPLSDVVEFQQMSWPGQIRTNWPSPGFVPQRAVQVNSLWWPTGASRYALAHYCCSDSRLQQIVQQVYAGGGYAAKPLIIQQTQRQAVPLNTPIDTVVNSITTNMFLISARPLFQFITSPGQPYWLITLADDRYWWWYRDSGAVNVDQGTTTWDDLYNILETQLEVTFDQDAVDAKYLTPTTQFEAQYENSARMLDAVAYMTGMRVARTLAGSVNIRNPVNALADLDGNLALQNNRQGGGYFRLTAGQPQQDFPGILPQQLRFVFPLGTRGSTQAITVTLASLALADFANVTTNAETKTFHMPNAYSDAVSASLTTMCQQFATDWYRWMVCKVDERFNGIMEVVPDAFTDVEWHHGEGENNVWTRLMRAPLNDLTDMIGEASAPTPRERVVPGLDGDEGEMGLVVPGPRGKQGIQGKQGRGIPGLDGDEGEMGLVVPGPRGKQGPQGHVGPTVPGLDGDEGEMGFGFQGPRGKIGPQGHVGPGIPGLDGDEGEMGLVVPGPRGKQGLQGHVGAGIPGLDGEDGEVLFLQKITKTNLTAQDNITAHSGGGQSLAYQLVADINRVTSVAAQDDSVKLPPSFAGKFVVVINRSSQTKRMRVFGAGTDTINGVATGTGVGQAPNSTVVYFCTTIGNWDASEFYLTSMQGYDVTATQLLGHDTSDVRQWYSTSAC